MPRLTATRSLPVFRLVLLFAPGVLAIGLAAGPRPAPARKPLAERVQSLGRVAAETTSWGSLRWVMNARLDPAAGITLGVVELKAGQSNPLHTHPNSEEVIYVLSGSCRHRVGNDWVTLKAGDALHIPAGVPHSATASPDGPMRCIVAYNTGTRQFKPVKE